MSRKTKGPARLTQARIKAIHDGLKKAGFRGLKLASLVLKPDDSQSASASRCHSVQLPDGSWTIVCE